MNRYSPTQRQSLSIEMIRKNLSFLLLLLLPLFVSCEKSSKEVYIVYLGEHSGEQTHQEIQDIHHSYIFSVKETEDDAKSSFLYSYKNSINGFAALLTEDEASILSEKDEVISVFSSKPNRWSLQTTRSWKFVGLEEEGYGGHTDHGEWGENILQKGNYGKDVIIGLLDSGVWPESKSFHDEGLGPVPKKWKGVCQAGDSFDSTHCNRKLIGARYYLKSYEHYNGRLNVSNDYRSPRDRDGHGTHTSSTAAGRVVHNISAAGGYGRGTASGGAPLARIAMYKVCWPRANSTLGQAGDTCLEADMLAAIDDAIGDGVDVISISIGSNTPVPYTKDGIALGALHAVKKNIVVSCAAGNNGPNTSTVSNFAPWILTVAASSIDRIFSSPVLLGNGMKINGQTVTPYKLKNQFYPLVFAGDVVKPNVAKNSSAGQCLPGSLSPEKVKGKIVFCLRGEGTRVAKGDEVSKAGGAGYILGNSPPNGNELTVDAHVLPATAVIAEDATKIFDYIKSTKKPVARIIPAVTFFDTKPAPFMAGFSSVGPNPLDPNILKPDITAPGLNILAAWSEASSPTKLDSDHRVVQYNFDSGTSMACPHAAGVAALIKAVHPTWSSAAIRSAIATTANVKNNIGKQITAASGAEATPFNYGSGHIQPTKAADPGLVYDASYTDYLLFLCSSGVKNVDPTFKCPNNAASSNNLNRPSLAIANLNGTMTVTRTVTNVGRAQSFYVATVDPPHGYSAKISPKILYFTKVGEKKNFTVTVKAKMGNKVKGGYSFGSYTWKDGVHEVRSPIVVS